MFLLCSLELSVWTFIAQNVGINEVGVLISYLTTLVPYNPREPVLHRLMLDILKLPLPPSTKMIQYWCKIARSFLIPSCQCSTRYCTFTLCGWCLCWERGHCDSPRSHSTFFTWMSRKAVYRERKHMHYKTSIFSTCIIVQ